MTTWAIGDVHGCYRTLRRLLKHREIGPRDDLWFVGDLVNRGPRSRAVLQYVSELGPRATVVLGNHDLHFLARAIGVAGERKRDTLKELLEAPDLPDLAAWLLHRPLARRAGDRLLVHAGVHADWSTAQIERRARAASAILVGPRAAELLASYRPRGGARRPPSLPREPLEDLRVLTLLRTCTREGTPRYDFAGPPEDRPRGRVPWFDVPWRKSRRARLFFGHWAALGLLVRDDVVALDTGCAWGGLLTAIRLEDGRVIQAAHED